jgi:DNA-binding transcriptional MerR regulator
MGERRYLSIGEVLGLLLEEFPDVTISKIRFLESQGLIDPERTPSGYRKFYDGDVERLRMILREQRENYLPLKVIKDRLESGELTGDGDDSTTGSIRLPRHRGAAWFDTRHITEEAQVIEHPSAGAPHRPAPAPALAPGLVAASPTIQLPALSDPITPPAPPTRMAPPPPPPLRVVPDPTPVPSLAAPARTAAPGPENPRSATPGPDAPRSDAPRSDAQSPDAPPSENPRPAAAARVGRGVGPDAGTTSDDVCALAGVEPAFLLELESFGLVESRQLGALRTYDAEAVRAVVSAARLCQRGLEPRHLRVWRTTVDKELALIEQLVAPLMRQRNPKAREHAAEVAHDIEALGAELRAALLRAALRHLIG